MNENESEEVKLFLSIKRQMTENMDKGIKRMIPYVTFIWSPKEMSNAHAVKLYYRAPKYIKYI